MSPSGSPASDEEGKNAAASYGSDFAVELARIPQRPTAGVVPKWTIVLEGDIVLIALYTIVAVASAFSGYAGAPESQRSRLPVSIMGILVRVVILLIQHIDRPNAGFITVSQQPMVDTAASLSSYSD